MRVRIPGWAVEQGMPEPGPDETFEQYWQRVGITDQTIRWATKGLDDRTLDVANDRMASYLARMMPDAWASHLDRLLADTGATRHGKQTWM